VVGLKPTHGLIDSSGAFAAPTICEVGPITRTVEDAALLLEALTGAPYAESLLRPTRPTRIGVPRRHIEAAESDRQIGAAFADARGRRPFHGRRARDACGAGAHRGSRPERQGTTPHRRRSDLHRAIQPDGPPRDLDPRRHEHRGHSYGVPAHWSRARRSRSPVAGSPVR